MNAFDKIVFVNRAFALSDTGRISYDYGLYELTEEEWESKVSINDFEGLSEALDSPTSATLQVEKKLTKEAAADLNEYGRLLARSIEDVDNDELDEELSDFWDNHFDTESVFYDVEPVYDVDDYLKAKEGDTYWTTLEYGF